MSNEKGYTLIELIIVIAILGIILLIAVPSFTSISETNEVEHFFEQLQDDLYFTQAMALSRGKPILLDFRPSISRYQVRDGPTPIFRRDYPQEFIIEKGSMETTVRFNQNGNIQKIGSFYVETKKERYKITFQLGKGRFDVTKL